MLRDKYGVRCGVVLQQDGRVLFVTGPPSGMGPVQVGCDMTPGGWWFTWPAHEGRTFAHVEDLEDAAKTVIRELNRDADAS